MSTLQITSFLRATKVAEIPMTLEGEAFVPGDDYTLLLTGKLRQTDKDEAAIFQLSDTAGITVENDSTAVCTLVPEATAGVVPMNLYAGIRATHKTTGVSHIVAAFRWDLKWPPSLEAEASIPIYTQLPPVTGGQVVFNRFDGTYYRLFIGLVEGDDSGKPVLQAEPYSAYPVDVEAPVCINRIDGSQWLIFIDETDGDGVPVIQVEELPTV